MWRHFASNALTMLVLIVFVAGGVILWAKNQYTQPGPLADAICLRVESGSKIPSVARQLNEEGAISNETIFKIGAEYSDSARSLKAGSFLLREGISMAEINAIITGSGRSTCGTEVNFRIGILRNQVVVSELDPETNRYVVRVSFDPAEDAVPTDYTEVRDDPDVRFRVTLAEGATSWQITEGLKAADFLDGEVAGVPVEGTLAPDSYEVASGTVRSALITQMTEAQKAILEEAWRNRAADLPYETIEEALIMASIVEKETGVPEERGQVASVFVNRLRQGIRLQTDPTVIYGITLGQGSLGRGLRQSELRRETPWNTYLIDALPPTPIANPGKASIEAALNPEETDYLFFVADGSGGHAFAKTLAEHNENVAKWRAIEAERSNN
ncbi:endolytic transglycosylase MltG [Pseudohalocynthiibacter sp. F2068]|jgi:peptidoglycan lytic transglycosylase G|uniref:endolytic transglycosylase MltG n=1 Tax=Pseudohalocynthiibacter sp. F2068 TaxID=2926418 RepID=UPI001FF516CA|nr:endolytic transglycosylase MltG [Pseudohalocynthiibacter sp. F2068]MCK0101669.1 endolytic transglycosylase MltG [Pseudohalocynthiibacter sp. F2068]